MFYHSSPQADKLAATIARDYSVMCRAYQCTVESWESVSTATSRVKTEFGRLDVMISNAGIPSKASGLDDSLEGWHRAVDVNLTGAYHAARAAGSIFREQGHGSMIFTSSMSGHAVNYPQQQASYNAAKAAVSQLSKSLAVEWADFARVNTVSPGYVDDRMNDDCPFEMKEAWYALTPLRRLAKPAEFKAVYLYLASDASTYTTGADIIVDGGYTCR